MLLFFLSHRFSFSFYTMCTSCQSVHNGIGQGGFIDILVPFGDRQLRGDDKRFFCIPVFQDLQQGQFDGMYQRLDQANVGEDAQRDALELVE